MIAIVDIGSNAVKYKIFDKKSMEIIEYVREPLRLGTDVFTTGSLSIEKINALLKLLKEYKNTFEIKNINECHFIATSAIRDASNNKLMRFIRWKPKFNNLRKIVKSCLIWEKRQ